MLLGITRQLRESKHDYEAPIYLATVEIDTKVVGCALRTPPFKLGLTRMPEAAVAPLVADVHRVYEMIPAVVGPEPAATRFAELWSNRVGCDHRRGLHLGLFELASVQHPVAPPPGKLRLAGPDDLELVRRWGAGFIEDTHETDEGIKRLPDVLVRAGKLYLWEDPGPKSMAGVVGESPNGARVGYVYTPVEYRGRGYASILVAELSDLLLKGGRRFCCLYADLANPTSCGVYERIGYRRIRDVLDITFL